MCNFAHDLITDIFFWTKWYIFLGSDTIYQRLITFAKKFWWSDQYVNARTLKISQHCLGTHERMTTHHFPNTGQQTNLTKVEPQYKQYAASVLGKTLPYWLPMQSVDQVLRFLIMSPGSNKLTIVVLNQECSLISSSVTWQLMPCMYTLWNSSHVIESG